jgi:hypothetical protein
MVKCCDLKRKWTSSLFSDPTLTRYRRVNLHLTMIHQSDTMICRKLTAMNFQVPWPREFFFFALPERDSGRERKGKEEREKDMEDTGDDRVESGGSTRVEFRESVYCRQIIGNWWIFSVCRRSSDAVTHPHSHSIIYSGTGSLMFTPPPTPPFHTLSQMSS